MSLNLIGFAGVAISGLWPSVDWQHGAFELGVALQKRLFLVYALPG
jgi:hypothetical protein